MVTCPSCWGTCDVSKIQVEEIVTDSQNFYYCKNCKRLSELTELDSNTLECTWNEEFLAELQTKIDAVETEGEEDEK